MNNQDLRKKAEALYLKERDTAGKKTYGELETLLEDLQIHQIELTLQNEELQQTQQSLEISRDEYYRLFNEAPVGYLLLDQSGMILEANHTFTAMVSAESSSILQKPFSGFVYSEDQHLFLSRFKAFYKNPQHKEFEVRLNQSDNSLIHVALEGRRLDRPVSSLREFDVNNSLMVIVHDVTSTKYLKRLEESNAALNVLLQKNEESKLELEENVLTNVRQLILPTLDKIRGSGPGEDVISYLDELERNLTELVSPFARILSSTFLQLTPAEIRVANYIKQGKESKEISSLLGCSKQTIDFHRKNIRKKLGITSKKTNLKTYLLSLQ